MRNGGGAEEGIEKRGIVVLHYKKFSRLSEHRRESLVDKLYTQTLNYVFPGARPSAALGPGLGLDWTPS